MTQAAITFSQHAHALELLKEQLAPGKKALDVGSGSGYLTACFALMVGLLAQQLFVLLFL